MYKIRGNDGKEYGPVATDQLHQWIREGRANAQTLVLPEGGAEWQPLGAFPEFAASLNAPVTPSVPTGAATATGSRMNPLALTGFILSIVGIPSFCCCFAVFPLGLAGLICSIIGLNQIKGNPLKYSGRGLALAGIIISILTILFGIGWMCFNVAFSWQDIMREIKKG